MVQSNLSNQDQARASKTYFAHTLPGTTEANWEPLRRHLDEVSELTAQFAGTFGAHDWGRIAGSWHDLGKYADAFQDYIRGRTELSGEDADAAGRVDHSTAGAQHAWQSLASTNPLAARLLAYCISGHHSGLLNSGSPGTRRIRSAAKWRPSVSVVTEGLHASLRFGSFTFLILEEARLRFYLQKIRRPLNPTGGC